MIPKKPESFFLKGKEMVFKVNEGNADKHVVGRCKAPPKG
jgi:hypothetical protein